MVGKSEGRDHLGDTDVAKIIILKCVLNKQMFGCELD
jgi:hypothetical protein